MAFNPSPKVARAREIAKEFGKSHVIIIMLDGHTIEYASYGRDRSMCNQARALADVAYNAIYRKLKGGD